MSVHISVHAFFQIQTCQLHPCVVFLCPVVQRSSKSFNVHFYASSIAPENFNPQFLLVLQAHLSACFLRNACFHSFVVCLEHSQSCVVVATYLLQQMQPMPHYAFSWMRDLKRRCCCKLCTLDGMLMSICHSVNSQPHNRVF